MENSKYVKMVLEKNVHMTKAENNLRERLE